MGFEKTGNEQCFKEFKLHDKDNIFCIILLASGTLNMQGCTLSLDGIFKETHKKVPSVVALPNSYIAISKCNFKGDTTNDAETAGVVASHANVTIQQCQFAHHKSGAIMLNLKAKNMAVIEDNNIVSCETAGIYCQGESSTPRFKGNKIMFCKCSAIKTYLGVKAEIVGNEININDVGIEVVNNASKLVDNSIEKSHENGIKIVGHNPDTRSKPLIYRNKILSCGFNGIICTGYQCEPDIRGNIIQSNRKAGIKLNENAKANIGGTCKADLTEDDPEEEFYSS